MKVTDVFKVLDNVSNAVKNGANLVPCFVGPSGVGKSQLVHQWCAEHDFTMIDLRLALLDSSDFIGLPFFNEKTMTTVFAKPSWLPKTGKGVLFLDELNRGSTAVMNAVMQLLTERRIGTDYTLPPDWIIVTAINPENSDSYDVNSMDVALKNRVIPFVIGFDHKTLCSYAHKKNWSPTVCAFLDSGEWVFKEAGNGDEHYIAPRSWEHLSNCELNGGYEDDDYHRTVCNAILGKNIGSAYWTFCHQTTPVLYADIEKEFKAGKEVKTLKSFKKLSKQCNISEAGAYRADLLNSTVQSILAIEPEKLNHLIFAAIIEIIPADQAYLLLRNYSLKSVRPDLFISEIRKISPNLGKKLTSELKQKEESK
jgi:hypothetical protein